MESVSVNVNVKMTDGEVGQALAAKRGWMRLAAKVNAVIEGHRSRAWEAS